METNTNKFNSNIIRQWANLIGIIAAFFLNVYVNLAPPGGKTIGEISNTVFEDVLIIPASYAFAIWGLIYLGLISFGIYQVLPVQRENPILQRCGYFLVGASLAQIIWVFLFQYQLFTFSVLAMLGILGCLICLYLSLGISYERVPKKDKWLVHHPISIYFAWISVATIVNIASALHYLGWNSIGQIAIFWTIIMLIIGAIIAAIINIQKQDIAYPLVFIWAFIAIVIRHLDMPVIAVTAGILALGLVVLVCVKLVSVRLK
ncbi:MAG: tryptophan-rich sensory protein [Okeania sp. SIO2G4]|uniref:tryptophan-rich sensory protein n=1 Tax=unclassified Okeania TaxID=2634635 RepID=UPI0013B5B94E|nr:MULTISPECIES: tryptophan-rich sensory protein [unclassified Okeania]NEP08208.1 tryptophan-rich sensory protein [Okeania sp. SIO4D6]NEP38520.1 tryptophan-rich sensory protein [Okeania sp. SIO2H7]NEP74844.1 tryptophan-rich sensory protein [Okeania sp. SIO2G5]NEP95951.1 tryptophan-rich sensory protein [Okeania sp. SIO2F5]NEQ91556.1 tryptophan-rich sensory protein [Okeania sp. SIO2G4]